MPQTFDSVTLCTQDDLEEELDELSAFTNVSAERTKAIVAKAIAGGKSDIRRKLKGDLEPIFLASLQYYPGFPYDYIGWVETIGLDWSEIDTLLDYLANPAELKDCAVAASVSRLYNRIATRAIAKGTDAHHSAQEALVNERQAWRDLFEQRYSETLPNLWFDLDRDGKMSKTELTRANQGIRVA